MWLIRVIKGRVSNLEVGCLNSEPYFVTLSVIVKLLFNFPGLLSHIFKQIKMIIIVF